MPRAVPVLVACLLLTLTLGGCGRQGLDEAFNAARSAVGKKTVPEVKQGGLALRELDTRALSAQQRADRQALLTQLDGRLTTLTELEQAAGLTRAATLVDTSAPQVAQTSLTAQPSGQFWEDLVAETRSQVKSAACDAVLDALAPDQRTKAEPEDQGPRQYAEEALANLSKKYQSAAVRSLVDWTEYGTQVIEDGGQVASAIEQEPATYLQYLGQRQVQRGVIAYVKYCYPRPQRP